MRLGTMALGLAISIPARADEPDARTAAVELVVRWLVAQNQRNFSDYEALYAADSHGVRRSGPRTVALDRAGWLRDRKRMFRKPLTVTAGGMAFAVQGDGTKVDLTQRFSQGSYYDVGPKRLVLARRDGILLIVEEEMVESAMPGEDASPSRGGDSFSRQEDGPFEREWTGDAEAVARMRALSAALGTADLAPLRALLPKHGPVHVEASTCVGDPCEEDRRVTQATRETLGGKTFIDVYLDASDQVECEASKDGASCTAFSGGWVATYGWTRAAGSLFLYDVSIQTH